MEEEKTVEAVKKRSDKTKGKKSKKIRVIIVIFITLMFSFFVLVAGRFILFGDKIFNNDANKGTNNVSNAHRFTGDILFSQIAGDYSFVTEFLSEDKKVGNVKVNFLYKNAFVSDIVVAENISIENISDYSIIFNDYNNDGTTDFSHISSVGNNESIYKIYTLTKDGKLIRLDENEYSFKSNKFSLKLEIKDGKYIYSEAKVYYDGYEIGLDTGTYKLNGKKTDEYSKVNGESKISFEDGRKIEKPVFETLTELNETFFNKHSLLKDYNELKVINTDLDKDGAFEKIGCFYNSKTNNTRIIMFDNNEEVVVNFVNVKDKKYKLEEVIELLDIDNDGTIEIITKLPDSNEVTISKYYLGYYFPEIEY